MTHILIRLLRLLLTALESKSEFAFVADDFPLEFRVLANMLPLWGATQVQRKRHFKASRPNLEFSSLKHTICTSWACYTMLGEREGPLNFYPSPKLGEQTRKQSTSYRTRTGIRNEFFVGPAMKRSSSLPCLSRRGRGRRAFATASAWLHCNSFADDFRK